MLNLKGHEAMYRSHILGPYDVILQRAAAALFAIVMTAASVATLTTTALAPLVA